MSALDIALRAVTLNPTTDTRDGRIVLGDTSDGESDMRKSTPEDLKRWGY
jgi:hypothetical protein